MLLNPFRAVETRHALSLLYVVDGGFELIAAINVIVKQVKAGAGG